MHNSELDQEAARLADTHSPHMLAKMLVIEQKENIELAAHVERLKAPAVKLAATVENKDEMPLHKWALKCARLTADVQKAVNDAPATSHAYRDLIKQAEALESILLITGDDPAHSIRETIAHEVKQLRQQANQLENQ